MNRHLTSVGRDDVQGAIAALDQDGAVILRDIASVDQVEAIRHELAPHIEAAPYGSEDYAGLQTRRIGLLLRRSPTMREIVIDPTILALCAHYLGGKEAFQLHNTEAIDIGPGNKEQPLHTDDGPHFPWPPRPRDELLLAPILAIDDFREDNGGTRIILGSHEWLGDREPTEADPIATAVMAKGSVLFLRASVWHGGGPNRARTRRLALLFRYSRGWLRQGENQYLVVPPDVARTWDEELRAIIGYRVVNGLGDVWSPEFDDVIVQDEIPEFIREALIAAGKIPDRNWKQSAAAEASDAPATSNELPAKRPPGSAA